MKCQKPCTCGLAMHGANHSSSSRCLHRTMPLHPPSRKTSGFTEPCVLNQGITVVSCHHPLGKVVYCGARSISQNELPLYTINQLDVDVLCKLNFPNSCLLCAGELSKQSLEEVHKQMDTFAIPHFLHYKHFAPLLKDDPVSSFTFVSGAGGEYCSLFSCGRNACEIQDWHLAHTPVTSMHWPGITQRAALTLTGDTQNYHSEPVCPVEMAQALHTARGHQL